MSSREPQRSNKPRTLIWRAVFLSYVLGWGPVIYLMDRVPPTVISVLKRVYVPIVVLHLIPGVDRALTGYEFWWQRLSEKNQFRKLEIKH